MKVPVGVSNRHIHLTEETYKELFGSEVPSKRNDLTQPGMYATNQTVIIKTEKSEIESVRFLMPYRDYNQVEISRTDAYKLGLNPPVRDSGDLKNSETIEVIGPKGKVILKESTIVATRHVHMTEEFALKRGIKNHQPLKITIFGTKGMYKDTLKEKVIGFAKITEEAYLELHIDTDDANALGLKQGDIVNIEL